MPSMSTITISDRESTPVAHDFEPHSENAGIATFRESGASLVGANNLTVSSVDTGSKVKTRLKLHLPVVQTESINSVDNDIVVRTAYADVTFTFDKSATLQERENAVGLLYNALAESQTDLTAVVTGESRFY